MFVYAVPGLFLLLFVVGVLRDRRRFGNAVHLGLLVISLSVAVIGAHDRLPPVAVALLAAAILLVPTLGTLVLAVLLILNGRTMLRKEGRSLPNLLSLLVGLGILGLVGLMVQAAFTHSRTLAVLVGTLLLVTGYVAFLFVCFVGYAFLYGRYGRLTAAGKADFVVVLGSGLIGGSRVSPLLASRLEHGRAVYERQVARGQVPILITSGGQGPDEHLSEAEAMADYLTERGFPADRIVREDRSRTTEENLTYSRAIMEQARPGYRCVIVTNNFHAFRAALLARSTGVNGHVVGSHTAAYYWPSATIREFAAVFLAHRVVNFGVCLLIGLLGLAAWWRL
ncbi:YdcF family protein [Kitasatospora sp. NPDC001175]|uniref:YdcF family protein n=1 Tax=Kitasatospora sp. NPDC001175 TaxID=3157103 RepID=UPI003CFEDF23